VAQKNKYDDWAGFREVLNCDINRKVMQQKVILWAVIILLAIANGITATIAFVAVSRAEDAVRRIEAAENTIAQLTVTGRSITNNKKKR
jgi:hypothetical protein